MIHTFLIFALSITSSNNTGKSSISKHRYQSPKIFHGFNSLTLEPDQSIGFYDLIPQTLVLFANNYNPQKFKTIVLTNNNNPLILSKVNKTFGVMIGTNSGSIEITSFYENKTTIDFFYLVPMIKSKEYYLSTYPEDIFVIGNPPDGFTVCKDRAKSVISYWNVAGKPVSYSTSFIKPHKDDYISLRSDDGFYVKYKSNQEIINQRSVRSYLYIDWWSYNPDKKRAFKLIIRDMNSNMIANDDIGFKLNKPISLPLTRYQFNSRMSTSLIASGNSYGNFKRSKGVIPLVPLTQLSFIDNVGVDRLIIICLLAVGFITGILIYSFRRSEILKKQVMNGDGEALLQDIDKSIEMAGIMQDVERRVSK
ncbi:hypothetical protein TRFO_17215 [Tritrichomonas foetus]|uniref:Uncharacterized protein n=1 Tax=Tritrichomonas foetus TaxID=1144522 RepID=A0A1J4KP03_9EUKA|nr:hypothetical protein TRFO_17215 [Tritrichomonas foetus]|eukprot:OHT12842.1 hypothetical protein TRFO_17215 [Tritrichomonas foetus]